jgi:SAM-dependent methyltransferase
MAQVQSFEDSYFSGRAVYGDQLDDAAIAEWHRAEEHGYYELVQRENWDTRHEYRALNHFHAFSALEARRFETCLVLGCADGTDVEPIAPRVGRFVAIEPAEQWWRRDICGVPAEYRKPTLRNDLPLPDGSVDLVVSLGVLHHIPNVSHVLREVARVLRSGGVFVLREPIHTMGDWRRPRRGLTTNERGLPLGWLRTSLADVGLQVFRRRYCAMPTTERFARLLKLPKPYDRRAFVVVDWAMSTLMSWNLHYHRDTLPRKLAPAQVFICSRKNTPR